MNNHTQKFVVEICAISQSQCSNNDNKLCILPSLWNNCLWGYIKDSQLIKSCKGQFYEMKIDDIHHLLMNSQNDQDHNNRFYISKILEIDQSIIPMHISDQFVNITIADKESFLLMENVLNKMNNCQLTR